MASSGEYTSELRALLPAGRVCFPGDELSDAELLAFRKDSTQQFPASPGGVAFPANTTELAALVSFAKERGLPLVPSGGRTGLCGGAVAREDELVVSLTRMNRQLDFDPYIPALTFEAGATTRAVQDAASERDLLFPVDFASAGSASIGGNVATNAGGIHVIRYGMLRDWVMGLSVVTGTGQILKLGRPLRKDNTGLDLRQLFIGSEGILGFITEVTVRLTTKPGPTSLYLFAVKQIGHALELMRTTRAAGLTIHAFEIMDALSLRAVCRHLDLPPPFVEPADFVCLLEIETDQASAADDFAVGQVDRGLAVDVLRADSPRSRSRFWQYREGISESLSMDFRVHKNDISLPLPAIEPFLSDLNALLRDAAPGIRLAVFGHLGDGNLHLNLLRPEELTEEAFRERCAELDAAIYARVGQLEGSISAEHGIGLLKREHIHHSRSPGEIELLRQIKQICDPAGIMNPGKVLPDNDAVGRSTPPNRP